MPRLPFVVYHVSGLDSRFDSAILLHTRIDCIAHGKVSHIAQPERVPLQPFVGPRGD